MDDKSAFRVPGEAVSCQARENSYLCFLVPGTKLTADENGWEASRRSVPFSLHTTHPATQALLFTILKAVFMGFWNRESRPGDFP